MTGKVWDWMIAVFARSGQTFAHAMHDLQTRRTQGASGIGGGARGRTLSSNQATDRWSGWPAAGADIAAVPKQNRQVWKRL